MKKTASIKWTAILLSLLMLMTMIPAIGVTAAEGNVLFTKDTYTSAGAGSWNGYKNFYTYSGTGGVVVEYTVAPATADDAAKNAPTMLQFDVSGTTYQFMIKTNGIFLIEGATTPASVAGTFDLTKANNVKVVVHGNKIAGWVNDVLYVVYTMGTEYAGGNFGIFGNKCNITITNLTVSEGAELEFLHYEKSIIPTGRLNKWSLAGTPNYTHTGSAFTFETTIAPKTVTDGTNTTGFIVKFGVGVAEQSLTIAETSINGGGITAGFDPLDLTVAHKVKVQVNGTDVAVFIDGKPVLNYTMAQAYTGGQFALHSKSSATQIATTVFSDVTISNNTEVKPIKFFAASAITAASTTWGKYNTGYTYSGKGASVQFGMEPLDATAAETITGQMLLFVIDGENWQVVIEPTIVTLARNNGGTRVTRKARETDLTVKNNIRVDIYNNNVAVWINDEFILRGSLQEKEYTGGTFTVCSKAGRSKVTGFAITESPYQNDVVANDTIVDCTTAGIRDRLENNYQGLRFFEELNTVKKGDAEIVTVNGAEYTVKETYVLVSTEKYLTQTLGKTVDDLKVGLLTNGQKVKQTKIEKYRDVAEDGDNVTYVYSALLTNIPQSAKDQYVCARTYLVCTDAAGNLVEVYGEVSTTSVLDMYNASLAVDSTGSQFQDFAAMQEWMGV